MYLVLNVEGKLKLKVENMDIFMDAVNIQIAKEVSV
jgi:hypothetical protein